MRWLLVLFLCSPTFAAEKKAAPKKHAGRKKDAELMPKLRAALQDYEKGHFDAVIDVLNPLSEELPNPSLMILANSYSKKKQYADEVRILHVLVGQNEDNYEAHMLLGQGLMKQAMVMSDEEAAKKIQVEAVQVFRTVLKMRPKYKPAFDSLYSLLLHLKAKTDAHGVLAEGLERFGHRPELMREMCRLDSTNGYVAQALISCREAISLSPNYPDNYVYLSQSFFDQKESASAERELVGAAKRFPASEFVQWSAGTVFMKKKNYPVSARYFSQAVKADPASSRATFGYAQALFESGQEKEALDVFKKACKLDPQTVLEPFYAASSRLRQKSNPLASVYKESAAICNHN